MRKSLPRLFAALAAAVLLAAGCAGRQAPAGPVNPAAVFTVRAPLLNLLRCPTVTCDVIEDLQDGQQVAVLSPVVNGWVQVRVLPAGKEGFVLARFLRRD
jgi:uncharacterized protein YgiM (DUF1202 family)